MTTAMTTRDLARAAFAALIITAPMNTMTMADEIKRISANGTELAYVEVGQGEPIIFVHGALQDHRMWAEHLPKFAGCSATGCAWGWCVKIEHCQKPPLSR